VGDWCVGEVVVVTLRSDTSHGFDFENVGVLSDSSQCLSIALVHDVVLRIVHCLGVLIRAVLLEVLVVLGGTLSPHRNVEAYIMMMMLSRREVVIIIFPRHVPLVGGGLGVG